MATLAEVWSRVFANGMDRSQEIAPRLDASVRVRAFANEDVFFYVKKIDNSRLVREADPASRGKCWKLIGSVVGAAVLLTCVLLPSAYGLMAGYQIQSLRQESQRLANEQASLELKEAQLLSPARMEKLAREQQFVDPAPQKVVYLDNSQQGTLAMNGK
jgi:cell division protein FtsL